MRIRVVASVLVSIYLRVLFQVVRSPTTFIYPPCDKELVVGTVLNPTIRIGRWEGVADVTALERRRMQKALVCCNARREI